MDINSTDPLLDKRKGAFFRQMTQVTYWTEEFVKNAVELFVYSITVKFRFK